MKKGVLGNSTKFTGKHLCQSLFFNKIPGSGLDVFLWVSKNTCSTEHLWMTASEIAGIMDTNGTRHVKLIQKRNKKVKSKWF